jgi:Tol biopolymer transport system component
MNAVAKQITGKRSANLPGGWRYIELLVVAIGLTCRAVGGPFQLVTVPESGQPPSESGGGDSLAPIISPDGRYVAFASLANNLVLNSEYAPIPASFPLKLNVYVRDRTNLTTTLVSVNLSGLAGGNGDSIPTGISSNGQYVLFESSASDLVPGDTNNAADVFIRDLSAGTTTLVSANTNGVAGNQGSRGSVMTPDGRYVAFVTDASDLVTGDTNGIADVFVRDLQGGVTTLVSVSATASSYPGKTSSEFPDITPDGRYVAFYSTATNLVSGVPDASAIYVRDLISGATTWASSGALGAVQSAVSATSVVAYSHAISADGRFVAYQASPVNGSYLQPAGVILRYNVFSGVTDVVHTNAARPFPGPPESLRTLDMTPDGRFIAFVANTNSSPNSTCVYVWDSQSGAITLASGDLSNNVPANSACDRPNLDASGRFVLFLSSATNLVTNALAGDYHVYVRDLQAGTTTLVDADTNGFGPVTSMASAPQMTPDGRFVAFECPDVNLVPRDRNRAYDLFVRDLARGTTDLISERDATLPTATPTGLSLLSPYSVSPDGRYAAFASEAGDLVPGVTNGCWNIFVTDRLLGTNVLVSVATNGGLTDGFSSEPAISSDGRYVAFTSTADNLVAGDANKASDVFVRDLQAGTTKLLSINKSGTGPGNAASYSPEISMDGRWVLFRTMASDVGSGGTYVPGPSNNLVLRDMQANTNYLLTRWSMPVPTLGRAGAMTPDGRFVAFWGATPDLYYVIGLFVWDSLLAKRVYTNQLSSLLNVAISPDGNRIAYATSTTLSAVDRVTKTSWTIGSLASTIQRGLRFSGDGQFLVYTTTFNHTNQVYLYDFQQATNFLVSQAYDSSDGGYGNSDWPDISSDGRFVAYRSAAPNLVPGDTNGAPDVFLFDRLNNTTLLLSPGVFGAGAGDNRSLSPVFSGDARTLFFESWASDLVARDFNQSSDLFALSLYDSAPGFSMGIFLSPWPGQGPWLVWPVLPGKNCTVQFKNSVGDAQWQNLNGSVITLGGQAYLNDASAGAGPRLYRVVGY